MSNVKQMLNDSYEKKERKKKLHELLDKYDGNVQALENESGVDGINYMFAKVYLDEVLAERQAQKERSSVQRQQGRNEFEEYDDFGADRFREDMKRRRQESVENTVKKDKGEEYNENPLLAAANTVLNKLNIPYKAGEFVADVVIAKKYYDKMNSTGKKLVDTYGRNKGAGDGIDNYYHPLLQCELAKISPDSRKNGILLGYLKEVSDYVIKRCKGKRHAEIVADSKKDLKNNELGSNIGADNLDVACEILLDYLRTENMRNEKIR